MYPLPKGGLMSKQYIGDSVYLEIKDDGTAVLTTENGAGPTNTIILEPQFLCVLVAQLPTWCLPGA